MQPCISTNDPDNDDGGAYERALEAAEDAAQFVMRDGVLLQYHCRDYELEQHISMHSLAAIFRECDKAECDPHSMVRLVAACKVLYSQVHERIANDVREAA